MMKRDVLRFQLTVHLSKKFFTIISIVCLSGVTVVPSLAQTAEQTSQQEITTHDGQILVAPMYSTMTYLIDNTGAVNHTWSSIYLPGVSVCWLGDGMILRTIRVDVGPGQGGAGGGVQKVQWDGAVVWDFRYNTNGVLSHHDVEVLPNGNVLLIAWETKTQAEVIAAGRNPGTFVQGLWPDHIVEVQPTGPTSGDIVWEWHVWDHLIQDYDTSKANYGVVGDHPELVDINYATSHGLDWLHTNSIDYNAKFDQILLSVRNFNEIWVIDHSTTTAEAASHGGGMSRKGGDLLYRWGNPAAYGAGTGSDHKLFSQHDATWIDEGRPGEGNILVFNNGNDDRTYSSVDELVPPMNDTGKYYHEEGSVYGPETLTWSYSGSPPSSFFSVSTSGAERLASGNTLITNGDTGEVFEVTPAKEAVWQCDTGGSLFKAVYIPREGEPPEPNASDLDCSGSLSWTRIKPGTMVAGSFQVRNIGNSSSLLNWKVNTSSFTWGTWSYTPASGVNLSVADGQVTILVSVIAPSEKNANFEGYLRVENVDHPNDFEVIPVRLKTSLLISAYPLTLLHNILFYFLHKSLFIETLWNLFNSTMLTPSFNP